MNYIYDILLNFNKHGYEFYDWNINDNIIHIRKIPIFKVSSNDLYNIINNKFTIKDELLNKIINCTQAFSNKNIKNIKYACLFSDTKEVVAISFNDLGQKEKISYLLLDEREDVLEIANQLEEYKLDIMVKKNINIPRFKTRKEQEIYRYIKSSLNKNNYDKLKYTYFECFDKEEENYNKIIYDLQKLLKDNWDTSYSRIYNILKLSSTSK